jgi:hypothetical protein
MVSMHSAWPNDSERGPTAEVCAQDIANWYGWSRWKAWRWLVALERQHGADVVYRRGRKLFTTRAGLERVAATKPPEIDSRIERRLADLEAKAREQDARLDGISRDQIEFRRKAREWFKRYEKEHQGRTK